MTIAEAKVGPQVASAGAPVTVRAGQAAELITGDAHGRFYEANYRGFLFSACGAVAGVAPGTALSVTPPFVLYNPPASGKNLVIMRTSLGYVSGTLGAGSILYATTVAQVSAPSGGTTIVARQSNLLGGGGAGVGIAYQGSTLVNTPTILRPAWTLGAFLATTAAINPPLIDEVAGEFVVIPGGGFVMQGLAASGTSPLVLFGCTWEEVPV